MFKKLKVILGISALLALGAGLTACAKIGDVEKYQRQGYDVKITYDASDGKYYNRGGVSIVRMYKSEDYMQNGVAEIKLSDPTVENSNLMPEKKDPECFLSGWYKTRKIKTVDGTDDGNPVDYEGRELTEKDGEYYVLGTEDSEDPVSAQPAYVYSDYWDFATDKFTVAEDAEEESKSLTLYAGWVPYFEFNYYIQVDDDWVKYGTTSFDYRAVQKDETAVDYNKIYTPHWVNGAMDYVTKYEKKGDFEFPNINTLKDDDRPESLKGKVFTFSAAYEDEACTKLIEGSIEHGGTFDKETFTAENTVKNIYVVYDPFEKYLIKTPKQLNDYAKADAHYVLMNDIDFTDETWPSAFSGSKFSGEFVSSEGNTFKLSNVTANAGGSTYGGLFGNIGENAVIKNVTFENATVNLSAVPTRASYYYAFFSGNIDEKAEISGVTVGGMLRIGGLTVPDEPNEYQINMLAIGNTAGITNTGISLRLFGRKQLDIYVYTLNVEATTVDAEGNVTIATAYDQDQRERNSEYFDINLSSWRQNND